MKKKLLSLLLSLFVVVGVAAGCGGGNDDPDTSTPPASSTSDSDSSGGSQEAIDYAASVTLDMASTDTIKIEVAADDSHYTHIDGDTTHFRNLTGNLPSGYAEDGNVIKARYLAVNTPESTGNIEEWGKKASRFTKEALASATSIVLETDTNTWERDSNGRYLLWVWYKPEGATSYRNLNIELLQEGLAYASSVSEVRYSQVCLNAVMQAKELELNVHCDEKDPEFYYGDAIPVSMRELRLNTADYVGKRVMFEANVALQNGSDVYFEDYDEETDRYYGMFVFCGYNDTIEKIVRRNTRLRIVGEVSLWEVGGTYQISALKYDEFDVENTDHIQELERGSHAPACTEITATQLQSNVTITRTVKNEAGEDEQVTSTHKYGELAMNTSKSIKNLQVISVYTTASGNDKNAMTLTCKDSTGTTITIRTVVLKDEDKNIVTADYFEGKTIDVSRSIVDYYNGKYQLKVFTLKDFILH